MCSDKAGSEQHHRGKVCAVDNASTRRFQVRAPEYSPFVLGCDIPEATAGQMEAGIMLSNFNTGTLLLKDFPWMAAQTSLFLVLVLLLVGALGFTWKLHHEKERECQTKEKLQRELSWRKAQNMDDWRKARSYAANVTLDPDTAHFELFLSEDCRSMRREYMRQDLPEKPGRFLSDPCVLGHEAFSSGRHYWEVEVGDRAFWGLGICEENSEKTQGITESPQNGFWAMELCDNKYQALTSPPTLLPLSSPPSQVGIFLDYEAGDVSFYNAADGSHIYTFSQTSFFGPLRPYFCLWFNHPAPLTICH